ncbi:MAG: ATP-binding cassette domain-containing protein [Gammaproteobacteria bacterium]|nr:ATP-binding cassette domain-containing protein [Gammaproteobacteria bacterium]
MLVLERVGVSHGGFVLQLDSWQTASGQFHALLGRNGAGKSTLLKLLAGELSHRGHIRLHGVDLSDWHPLERARHLAVMPQASRLDFGFTAAEVVALGATPLSLNWRQIRREVQRTMEFVQCSELADQSFVQLSGGEKQRVQLARCLLQLSQAEQTPLLLLDEPTSAQDLGQQHALLSRIRGLCRQSGYGVVAVLHDLNHALRYANIASLLDAGRLAGQACPFELLTTDIVERYWNYSAERVLSAGGNAALL